jgi:hypothetical protein
LVEKEHIYQESFDSATEERKVEALEDDTSNRKHYSNTATTGDTCDTGDTGTTGTIKEHVKKQKGSK